MTTDAPTKRYHHGSLPEALLAAAEAVLLRDGIPGLGLRAIAREAGVSHTAPKHHFGDMTGLVSELAAVGYARLSDAMRDAAAAHPEPPDLGNRRHAIAHAYVHFAYDNPAMFGLMFRNEMIDMQRPVLNAAAREAMRVMAAIIGAKDEPPGDAPVSLNAAEAMRITAAWGYVHGLATLLIDQRLRGIIKVAPDFDDPVDLVDRALKDVRFGFEAGEAPPAAS
ncbi:transcriptional regulator, TetR family [Variovorax sp. OK605]|jgi:AcrR family transcriptional regulator|uniref:TetR/AcrR family transcriptional regulator n=1 Tax=unclassified Variovorax TaxID=663243 RepID=UPI0008C0389D|nr:MULTISPECIES: TetR/AcrR family transcriptional regulator [unclassified Variovorax]SEJ94235.1 transcriptional regulator, TetR family [Variovorax sp. OK202]SFD17592.1 transcriptional regulator, TetR family [Variovorax sp. OK212]SFP41727.1 transcriptional regulator, TetR family [Variovorax sp. OK605]